MKCKFDFERNFAEISNDTFIGVRCAYLQLDADVISKGIQSIGCQEGYRCVPDNFQCFWSTESECQSRIGWCIPNSDENSENVKKISQNGENDKKNENNKKNEKNE